MTHQEQILNELKEMQKILRIQDNITLQEATNLITEQANHLRQLRMLLAACEHHNKARTGLPAYGALVRYIEMHQGSWE